MNHVEQIRQAKKIEWAEHSFIFQDDNLTSWLVTKDKKKGTWLNRWGKHGMWVTHRKIEKEELAKIYDKSEIIWYSGINYKTSK